MSWSRVGIVVALLLSTWSSGWADLPPGIVHKQSVSYQRHQVGNYTVHVIYINPNDPNVFMTVELARGYPGTDEDFRSMSRRIPAVAGMTGTYFNVSTLEPICDIVIGGKVIFRGARGSAVALTADNRFLFRRVPFGKNVDWSGFETVLAGGPTILHRGQLDYKPHEEGFKDPHLLGSARRTAVGMTNTGKLGFISVPEDITLEDLGKVLLKLGFLEAINMDGGTSSAMFYRDQSLISPGRSLVNLLVVYEGYPVAERGKPRAKMLARRDISALRHAGELFVAARAALAAGNLDEAQRALYSATDADPKNLEYVLALADTLEKTNSKIAASNARVTAADLQVAAQHDKEALAELEHAIGLNPANSRAWRAQADIYARQGDSARAAEARLRGQQASFDLDVPSSGLGRPQLLRALDAADGKVDVTATTVTALGCTLPLAAGWQTLALDGAGIRTYAAAAPVTVNVRAITVGRDGTATDLLTAYHNGSYHVVGPIATETRGALQIATTECTDVADGQEIKLRCMVVRRGHDAMFVTEAYDPTAAAAADAAWSALRLGIK